MEIRVYDELPVFRMFLLDDKLFISGYLYGIHGHDATTYFIKKDKLSLFNVFDRYFESLWNRSKPWENSSYIKN